MKYLNNNSQYYKRDKKDNGKNSKAKQKHTKSVICEKKLSETKKLSH